MAQYHRPVLGSMVGASTEVPTFDHRTCSRCGIRKNVNSRNRRDLPYMCGDCKIVDKAMARRLGLA